MQLHLFPILEIQKEQNTKILSIIRNHTDQVMVVCLFGGGTMEAITSHPCILETVLLLLMEYAPTPEDFIQQSQQHFHFLMNFSIPIRV